METRAEFGERPYLTQWYAPEALAALKAYRSHIAGNRYEDVLKVILSRAARSARLTTHFDLDFPKRPQTEPYYCYKHRRTCVPTADAKRFLQRYSLDTLRRIEWYDEIRQSVEPQIECADARYFQYPSCDLVITSPPYVGLIDYHEQHRYAFELLDIEDQSAAEIGPAKKGTSLVPFAYSVCPLAQSRYRRMGGTHKAEESTKGVITAPTAMTPTQSKPLVSADHPPKVAVAVLQVHFPTTPTKAMIPRLSAMGEMSMFPLPVEEREP